MRSETQMLELIRNTALEDERIRAAWLEGSRANPNVPRDIFQDYDVVYVVNETESFREDKHWIIGSDALTRPGFPVPVMISGGA